MFITCLSLRKLFVLFRMSRVMEELSVTRELVQFHHPLFPKRTRL